MWEQEVESLSFHPVTVLLLKLLHVVVRGGICEYMMETCTTAAGSSNFPMDQLT